jgi:hypothetical protein
LVTEPLGIQSYDVASDRWTTAFAPHTHWAYAGVLPRPSILYVAADGLFYADTYDATTLTWNGSPPISPLVLSAGGEASPEIHTVHGRPFVVQSFPAPSRGVVRDTDGSFRPLPFGLPRVDADTVVVAMDDETLIWNAESKPRVLSIE